MARPPKVPHAKIEICETSTGCPFISINDKDIILKFSSSNDFETYYTYLFVSGVYKNEYNIKGIKYGINEKHRELLDFSLYGFPKQLKKKMNNKDFSFLKEKISSLARTQNEKLVFDKIKIPSLKKEIENYQNSLT